MNIISKKIILRSLKNSDNISIYKQANHKAIARYSDIPYPYSQETIDKFINKAKREERL